MEAIRSGVLSMGGSSSASQRAIEALGRTRTPADRRGRATRRSPDADADRQQCTQVSRAASRRRRPAPVMMAPRSSTTSSASATRRRRSPTSRRRARQRPADRSATTSRADGRRHAKMLRESLDAFARLDVNAAPGGRGGRTSTSPQRGDAPADQLHDGGPADDRRRARGGVIAKSIERIGDTRRTFRVRRPGGKGKDVRHASADQIRRNGGE